jgi:hypothetical protein
VHIRAPHFGGRMLGWFLFDRKKVLAEADELMDYCGDGAYFAARKKMREARDRGDRRQEKFYSRVAFRIAKLIDKSFGEDTATRTLYDTPAPLVRRRDATVH